MVKLGAMASLAANKNYERMRQWETTVERELIRRSQGNYKYACQLRKVMFGCYMMVFVREDNMNKTSQFMKTSVKTGAGGMAANKGSCSVRFNYYDSSFMFLNCHLTSG